MKQILHRVNIVLFVHLKIAKTNRKTNRPICVLYLHHNVEIPETKRFLPKGFELGTTLS